MEFVESDDGPPFRRPPALDDRLWRHPSEIGAGLPDRRARKAVPQTVWVAVALAAVAASAVSTGMLVAVGSAGNREAVTTTATVLPGEAPVAPADPALAAAERARPAIALIKVEKAEGTLSGSAVMFLPDGHLLTNAHMVDAASSIRIQLSDGVERPGRVVGGDPVTDTAVVKIDGTAPFPVAELGTATTLEVGQRAVTMGSPLAAAGGPAVAVGVIRALHRSVRTPTTASLFDMIQTDAPVAPGSSGGALLDANGRVIGITTAFALTDAGAGGVGFATPVDVARSVADELMSRGRATHAWLGIEGSDVDGATARTLSVTGGALVNSLREGGPAEAAGLAVRDVIVGADGTPVASMNALVVALRTHRPGEVMTVEVVRNGQRMTRSVTVTERPEAQ